MQDLANIAGVPLLLTGPPAVGKSSVARMLASRRQRCAVLEVDDIRQLVKSGAEAPWVPGEGEAQHLLAARNACLLTESFLAHGFDVVLTDVVLTAPAEVYRHCAGALLIVRLDASLAETRRRAATRPVRLAWGEFDSLHAAAQAWPSPDVVVDTENLGIEQLVERIDSLWQRTESLRRPGSARDGSAR